MKKTFTAFVEYDDEGKLYVGIIPNVPGAHTQAETLDELQRNLQEVLELCLEENPDIRVFHGPIEKLTYRPLVATSC